MLQMRADARTPPAFAASCAAFNVLLHNAQKITVQLGRRALQCVGEGVGMGATGPQSGK
jgi:hypothetical protein